MTLKTREELFQEIIADVRGCLQEHAAAGRRKTLSVSPEVAALLSGIATTEHATPLVEKSQPNMAPSPPQSVPAVSDVSDWPSLEAAVAGCTRCSLHLTRTNTVFGAGNRQAKLMFVGEAPGADEDAQGLPFVGAAGKLLTDIIEKGMKISREDVFICNVLKCRPPGNRTPGPAEVAPCEPYLTQQIALIQPKAICALGGVAAQALLKSEVTVGRLRGKWLEYQGIPLRVTYHPSYLLHIREADRLRAEKAKVWDDIQAVMKLLESAG